MPISCFRLWPSWAIVLYSPFAKTFAASKSVSVWLFLTVSSNLASYVLISVSLVLSSISFSFNLVLISAKPNSDVLLLFVNAAISASFSCCVFVEVFTFLKQYCLVVINLSF